MLAIKVSSPILLVHDSLRLSEVLRLRTVNSLVWWNLKVEGSNYLLWAQTPPVQDQRQLKCDKVTLWHISTKYSESVCSISHWMHSGYSGLADQGHGASATVPQYLLTWGGTMWMCHDNRQIYSILLSDTMIPFLQQAVSACMSAWFLIYNRLCQPEWSCIIAMYNLKWVYQSTGKLSGEEQHRGSASCWNLAHTTRFIATSLNHEAIH